MSVTNIGEWRLPGCTSACWPRSHDPESHEQHGRLMEREMQRQAFVRTGPLVVNLRTERVTVDGDEVHLSNREYGVLAYLTARPGTWHQTDDILRAVWGTEWVTGGVTCSPNGSRHRQDTRNVTVVTCRLRLKLGRAGTLIETQAGFRAMRRLRIEEPAP